MKTVKISKSSSIETDRRASAETSQRTSSLIYTTYVILLKYYPFNRMAELTELPEKYEI